MAQHNPDEALTGAHFTIQKVEKWCVVEFRQTSLMDPIELERMGQNLYHLVDAQDQRRLILDFSRVQYLSSQAIGVLLTLKRKLDALPKSTLVLCGVGPKLEELLKITRLTRVLIIKPTQREALKIVD